MAAVKKQYQKSSESAKVVERRNVTEVRALHEGLLIVDSNSHPANKHFLPGLLSPSHIDI